MIVNTETKMQGYFRICVKHEDGTEDDTGWFPNLITNQGMDWIGSQPPNNNVSYGQMYIGTHCGVGTGTTTPAFTDTHLTSFLAMYPPLNSSNVEGFSSSQYVAGPPAYWSGIRTYNFAIGAVVGNIAEVGIGNTNSTDTQPQLFTHALILVGGSPGTITVTSSDALVVYHEMRLYLDLTTNAYSFQISGVTYTGNYLRANIGTVPNFAYNVYFNISYTVLGQFTGYNGTTTTVTGYPTGTSDGNLSEFPTTIGTYTSGTYTLSMSCVVPLNRINLSGGITAFTIQTNHGTYQFSVSPYIPKTALYTLTMNWNVSWARYP
ncbi:MAG: hypothetical protein KGI54_07025 [Pseudomonadota bacterium]|nr:hypothetical protein [Pseudomonadota bacterium]